jgi:AcrR family transcriptional regulator
MEKKQAILKTAARLFANQGFDGTTTVQIAREAGVTEPLIFYHFTGKDELFTRIIESMFVEYFSRLDLLEKSPKSFFNQIQKLIELQFDIVEEFPDEVYVITSTRPVRLEYIIYRKLLEAMEKYQSFSFNYEELYELTDRNFDIHPDFVIYFDDGRKIYWEHLGTAAPRLPDWCAPCRSDNQEKK